MREDRNTNILSGNGLTRRTTLKGLGAAAGLMAAPGFTRFAQAQSSEPIRIGFQCHRTGIGAAYGRWYERVTNAAAKLINDEGGINGRPLEIVIEDDGTDPARGSEVVQKFANQHKVDLVYGTLFSHVVVGSAPMAGELKIPYYVVSEGYHVASGKLNRYCVQPGITDVKAQVRSVAPWIAGNLGKKVTLVYPDYAFGHDHRDFFEPAIAAQGGEVVAKVPIPPTETSFTRYFPQIPRDTDVIYHVMVGPAVLTFVKEMGEFFGTGGPQLFGFIDSLEAVDINSPGLEFLEGSHFWEGMPRYAQADQPDHVSFYRETVGIDENGASLNDPQDVSTAAHMFGCWETLHVIKAAMEAADYQGPGDRAKLIEATEAMSEMEAGREHPQGRKVFNGKIHQVFGEQSISQVKDGKLEVVHRTSIDDGLYEPEADYTAMSF
ncbi:ABC transporter substrate-binding protein [Chelativorans xinjiangense]|uniref:ABC transporter substrate-binding protein n=1 Tax=Chelativorans xinjiangense TaxID=2681485 RepID=UPI00135AFC66|nr:ABC transporter substrate-binding protein [Chelativorans xinjiangense]